MGTQQMIVQTLHTNTSNVSSLKVHRLTTEESARHTFVAAGSGSQRVQDDLPAISNKIEMISITIGIVFKNSSDLSSGRRPLSKSNEFSKTIPLVIEIWSPKVRLFTKTYDTFWEPDPAVEIWSWESHRHRHFSAHRRTVKSSCTGHRC